MASPPLLEFSSPTFLGARRGAIDDVRPGSIVISGAAFDTANLGRFGSRLGPNTVRAGSRFLFERMRTAGKQGLVDIDTGKRVSWPAPGKLLDVGDATMYPVDIGKTTESIAGTVAEIVRRGGWSIVLGGDHYISYPSVLGFTRAAAEARPDIKVGYIHIDGHLDFVGTNILGRYHNGNHAKLASELPQIAGNGMAFVGAAGWMTKSELDAIEGIGGAVWSANDVHRLGATEIAKCAADHAATGADVIYLTIDIDVIDCGYLPGRSGVDTNGLTPVQLQEMLRALAPYPIAAMDLVEINPRLDPSERSEALATEMIATVIASRKSFRPTWKS